MEQAYPLPDNTATDCPNSFSYSAVECGVDVVSACAVSVEFLAAVAVVVVLLGRVLVQTLVFRILSEHH